MFYIGKEPLINYYIFSSLKLILICLQLWSQRNAKTVLPCMHAEHFQFYILIKCYKFRDRLFISFSPGMYICIHVVTYVCMYACMHMYMYMYLPNNCNNFIHRYMCTINHVTRDHCHSIL